MRLLTGLLVLLTAPALAGDDLAAMNAVSKTWDRWAESSSKDDPASADLLAPSSFTHFEFLRDAALYASAEQIRRLPTTDRFHVYFLRSSQDEAALKALDARAVARLCISQGLCGVSAADEGEALTTLSHVTVIGDHALGEYTPPTETQYQFGPEFALDQGQWKLMYESMVLDSSLWLDQQLRQSGTDTGEALRVALFDRLGAKAEVPALAVLDRPLSDDPARRIRLNETWPDYQNTYQQRFKALRSKAEDGDTLAQYVVGALQYSGAQPAWVAKDESGGMKMLERASDGGNAKAASAVVEILLSDRKKMTPETLQRALPHLRRAAEDGQAPAMAALGGFYFNGAGGLQRDCTQAAEWQARAEEAGLPSGRNDVIWTYATCPIPGQRDAARALQLSRHLIERKDKLERYELDTVAATYAANRDFAQAVAFQQLAIAKLDEDDLSGTRKGMETRLKRYRKQQDWVQDFNSFDMKDGY